MSYLVSQFGNPRGIVGTLVGHVMASKNRERNACAISRLKIRPDDHVLEISFGPGAAIEMMAQFAVRGFVAGIDPSETMLRQATARNAHVIASGRAALHRASVSSRCRSPTRRSTRSSRSTR